MRSRLSEHFDIAPTSMSASDYGSQVTQNVQNWVFLVKSWEKSQKIENKGITWLLWMDMLNITCLYTIDHTVGFLALQGAPKCQNWQKLRISLFWPITNEKKWKNEKNYEIGCLFEYQYSGDTWLTRKAHVETFNVFFGQKRPKIGKQKKPLLGCKCCFPRLDWF